MENNLSRQLEAILFYHTEPIAVRKLAALTNTTEEQTRAALRDLEDCLAGRGVCVVVQDDRVMFATAPEYSSLIAALAKEELEAPLSKASLETLAVVLYRHPVAKPEVDYIRGVNSGFILRSLLVRGLIEREPHAVDRRMYVYKPSFELLRFLGIENLQKLPDYGKQRDALEKFFAERETIEEKAADGETAPPPQNV